MIELLLVFSILTASILFAIGYMMLTGKLEFGTRFFVGFDNFLHGLNDWFGKSAAQLCRLETSNHPLVLVADDGSLISVIELFGTSNLVGDEEFQYIMTNLSDLLSVRMGKRGYTLQVSMLYDPDEAKYEINELMRSSRHTCKTLGLDVTDMLDDAESSIAQYCASEHVYLVLWTCPESMPPVQLKNAKNDRNKAILNSPVAKDCQVIARALTQLQDGHLSSVNGLVSSLKQIGLISEALTAHKSLWVLRRTIDKSYTGRGWRALLPGDPLSKTTSYNNDDLSGFLYPKIGQQLFPRSVGNFTDNILRVGHDIWHGSLVMTRPPQNIQPFNVFFRNMLNTNFPYRISFTLHGDGLNGTLFKQLVSRFLHFASTNNRLFNQAIDALRAKQMEGGAITTFQCTLGASVYGETDEKTAIRNISERMSILASNTQSWGACDVRDVVGDPILGLNATLPGMMRQSPGPKASAPIDEAILMMPFTRPASLWQKGNVIFRTADGKIMPYQMGSSLQAAWVDLGVSPMGGGKSVHLNTLNFAFVTQEGLVRLPWLSILDIGPSSSGIVELIRASLPDNKKYLAQYHRLRMTSDYAINPMDLPLGMDRPIPSHKSYLVNLFSLFGTELGADAPIDGIAGIARTCIDLAYDEFSQKRSPKPYQKTIDLEVDRIVEALSIHVDKCTSWWEIRDILFENGYIHEATRAQRFAVPVLAEVAAMVKQEKITSIYKHSTPNKEPITDFFWRQCIDVIAAYPILKGPTRFDISDAQIVSLDLDEVAPRGGAEADRQTAVMYMIGRHVVASRFFLMPEDAKLAAPQYQKWMLEQIENIRQDPKRLCYDEMHRVIRNAAIAKQVVGDIETISRESRKWNLSLGVYSQSIEDFPEIIVELATSLYIFGVGTARMAERIAKIFGLNDTALIEMQRLGKPDKRGSNFIGIFKAANQVSVHRLTNTIGMQALWAFDTTTENVTVRNKLYQTLGVSETLKRLARLYPGGLKDVVEKRKSAVADAVDADVDIIKALVNEISADK